MATTEETARVHRTTVDIDLDALEAAKEVLGTVGFRDTVNEALREVMRIAKLRRLAERIRNGEDLLAPSPEELHRLRHERIDRLPR